MEKQFVDRSLDDFPADQIDQWPAALPECLRSIWTFIISRYCHVEHFLYLRQVRRPVMAGYFFLRRIKDWTARTPLCITRTNRAHRKLF